MGSNRTEAPPPGVDPGPRRRTIFRRMLITMLALLITYAALTVMLAYQLGASVLHDVYQRELLGPHLTTLEETIAPLVAAGATPADITAALQRRYDALPRMTVAVYDAAGRRVAQKVGLPGHAPDHLRADARDDLLMGRRLRTGAGFHFVAAAAVTLGDEAQPRAFVRMAAEPSTDPTRELIAQVSWRWGFPIFLLSMVAAFLGSYSITRRLRSAEAAVRRLAEGDSSARIPVDGTWVSQDELGRVAMTFNHTADLLQNTIAELERTMATRKRLLSDLAHEMNTPLTNVSAYLESLLMAEEGGGMEDTMRGEFLQVAMDETTRLRRLARDMDTIIKLDSRRVSMERELVDLSQLVRGLAARIRPRAEQQGLDVLEVIEDFAELVGDPMRLEQVGMNLLENALRYTNDGAITVRVARVDGGVEWDVCDTGIGIPADDLPHVMDRFYRVDSSRTRATGGSGLGLSIVGKIVERHGGTIDIHSEVGRGTRVMLWFPHEGTMADSMSDTV